MDLGGKIDALYFNPRPINIAKAEATRDDSKLSVFVELRAPNYPGSTYTLVYDRMQDQLKRDVSGGSGVELRCGLREDEVSPSYCLPVIPHQRKFTPMIGPCWTTSRAFVPCRPVSL